MNADSPISIAVNAVYDVQEEAVGLSVAPSEGFESGVDTRAMIESLAAIAAKANQIAAEVIRQWDAPEERKKLLIEHFASLKENMLADMLRQQEAEEADSE